MIKNISNWRNKRKHQKQIKNTFFFMKEFINSAPSNARSQFVDMLRDYQMRWGFDKFYFFYLRKLEALICTYKEKR